MTDTGTAQGTPADAAHEDGLADDLIGLCDLALTFGQVERVTAHPDGTPESDATHTVMLGWVACTLAARHFPHLDRGLIAEFALVHDAAEVYAGDTNTLVLGHDQGAKAEREERALLRLEQQLQRLPWLTVALRNYERQFWPEARFVRAVDKLIPKAVHILDEGRSIEALGISPAALRERLVGQIADIQRYAGEFTELIALQVELVERVTA